MRTAQRDWVVAAAERAEQRLRGEIPRAFHHSTDRSTAPAAQLQALIAAIMNPQITRKKLRQLADAVKTGRVS
jgi:hypothetical protein